MPQVKCPTCDGRGGLLYEPGLLTSVCARCAGTGRVETVRQGPVCPLPHPAREPVWVRPGDVPTPEARQAAQVCCALLAYVRKVLSDLPAHSLPGEVRIIEKVIDIENELRHGAQPAEGETR